MPLRGGGRDAPLPSALPIASQGGGATLCAVCVVLNTSRWRHKEIDNIMPVSKYLEVTPNSSNPIQALILLTTPYCPPVKYYSIMSQGAGADQWRGWTGRPSTNGVAPWSCLVLVWGIYCDMDREY